MRNLDNTILVGLRIDVDTFRGTRDGVPQLLNVLAEHNILASFFFSVGPDNMGRHLWRLLNPSFLIKMLRSNAASLYGWDILLRGTFFPGPKIGKDLSDLIQDAAESGHEIGLHAWDHHLWQAKAEHMSREDIRHQLHLGAEALQNILNRSSLSCSAVAGWKCTEKVILEKEAFDFHYNSDCRGFSIFRPFIDNQLCTPQIPVTLPTYDEVIGRNGITDANYNEYLLSLIKPDQLNVLTIHAEVEGIARRDLFLNFLEMAQKNHIQCVPLSSLLPDDINHIPQGKIQLKPITGRQGTVCWQSQEANNDTPE